MNLQPPSHSDHVKVSFPAEHVFMICLDRPKALNAMSDQMANDLRVLFNWFDEVPSLWCVSPVSSKLRYDARPM
jgi:enoyl-CoA hydratase/carnithine racemase